MNGGETRLYDENGALRYAPAEAIAPPAPAGKMFRTSIYFKTAVADLVSWQTTGGSAVPRRCATVARRVPYRRRP
jgi:hypothetical protein